MIASSRSRPGFALAVALAAIVIIGAMIAGALFAATQRARSARDAVVQVRALAAAEYGAEAVTMPGEWDAAWLSSPPGRPIVRTYASDPAIADTVRVTRLTSTTFLITSAAVGRGARRVVSLFITVGADSQPLRGRGRYWSEMN